MRSETFPLLRDRGFVSAGEGLWERMDDAGVVILDPTDLYLGDGLVTLRVDLSVSPAVFVDLMVEQGVPHGELWGPRGGFWHTSVPVPEGCHYGEYGHWEFAPDDQEAVRVFVEALVGDLDRAVALLDPAVMLEEVRRLGRGIAALGRLKGFAAEALMLFGTGEVEEAVRVAGQVGRDDLLLYHLSQLHRAEAARDFILARAAAGAGKA